MNQANDRDLGKIEAGEKAREKNLDLVLTRAALPLQAGDVRVNEW